MNRFAGPTVKNQVLLQAAKTPGKVFDILKKWQDPSIKGAHVNKDGKSLKPLTLAILAKLNPAVTEANKKALAEADEADAAAKKAAAAAKAGEAGEAGEAAEAKPAGEAGEAGDTVGDAATEKSNAAGIGGGGIAAIIICLMILFSVPLIYVFLEQNNTASKGKTDFGDAAQSGDARIVTNETYENADAAKNAPCNEA